jgi:hypothetical protein
MSKTTTKTKTKKIDRIIKLPDRSIPHITIKSKPYKGLLLYILDVIKLNPDHHNQREWRCDTSFCFAGFTDLIAAVFYNQNVILHNVEFSPSDDFALTEQQNLLEKIYEKEKEKGDYTIDSVDDIKNVETVAKYLLGVSDNQAEELFRKSRNLNEVEETVNRIIKGDII